MICRVLPNRMIVLVMTPREASMLEGQILDPADFPWQDSETQVTALAAKSNLYRAVADVTANELEASVGAILDIAQQKEANEREEVVEEEQQPPEMTVQLRKETNANKRTLLGRGLGLWERAMGPLQQAPETIPDP